MLSIVRVFNFLYLQEAQMIVNHRLRKRRSSEQGYFQKLKL